jgi:tetratricopeptide (TPR) repeat protein
VVFDDIQWGEETFRDLIEHVVLLATAVPLLLLCMARPELVERRPTWPVTLPLGPLMDEAVDKLIPQRIEGDLRRRIAHASGGNPLFIAEMLAITAETNGDIVVPPTLQALLAARLDQLEPAERSVLERASIEGEIFHRGAVQALAPDQSQVTPHLAALVRKQLIRPERAQLFGEDGFGFRHLLIRDAAYEALPKATRADLHVRLAAWLEHSARALVELDEILAYHLEQACRYRVEVGLPEDDALATAARRRLTDAGQRAARRQDYDAAASLFERAAALVPPAEIDLALESELNEVLFWTGRAADALRRADALAERAAAAGNRVGELCGRIKAALIRRDLEPEVGVEELEVLLEHALPELEAAGDDVALYIAHCALGDVAATRGHVDATLEANERALVHAQRSGYEPSPVLGVLAWCRFVGTTPVSELLAWLDENEPHAGPHQFFRAYRAWSIARLGRFDEARAFVAEARTQQAERGGGVLLANLTAFESVWIELLAGDPAAAAAFGAEGCRLHELLGEQPFLATAAGSLAQALYALDRLEEADAWAGRAADLAGEAWAHMLWRQVRGKVLARRGEHTEALRLARKAVAIADDTDQLDRQGDAYADLAEVLLLGGKHDQAATALEHALGRYERKGNLVSAERARTRLAELHAAAPHRNGSTEA